MFFYSRFRLIHMIRHIFIRFDLFLYFLNLILDLLILWFYITAFWNLLFFYLYIS